MQQDMTIEMIEPGPSAYVSLFLYIGMCKPYNPPTLMAWVKHLKLNATLLVHLSSAVLSSGSSEIKTADNDGRRDISNGH